MSTQKLEMRGYERHVAAELVRFASMEWMMKVCTNMFGLALLALISAWGLSGCSTEQQAPTTGAGTRLDEAEKDDEHVELADAKASGHKGEEHAKQHDDKEDEHAKQHGHTRGAHKDHGVGEHEDMETAPEGSVKVGDKVPDFSVRTLDGKSVKLSKLQKDERQTRNGVVVLSFWCSTCHSCRDVEDLLAKLYKDYAGQAAVMALAANAGETATSVAAFVKETGLELPIVLDPSGNTADLFGVKMTTTTVVIDGHGVLRYCGQFRQKGDGSAEEALKAVLAGKEVAVKTTPHRG